MSNCHIGWSWKRALDTAILFLKNKLIIIFIRQCQKLLFVMFRCVQIFDSFLLAIMMHQTYPCHLKSLIMLEHFRLFIGSENYWDIWRIFRILNERFLYHLFNYSLKFVVLRDIDEAMIWKNQPEGASVLHALVIWVWVISTEMPVQTITTIKRDFFRWSLELTRKNIQLTA